MRRESIKVLWTVLLVFFFAGSTFPVQGAHRFRLATFRSDVTPPAGEPLIWNVPLIGVRAPLWAKGIVLEEGKDRYILCSIDWCELGGGSELDLRQKMAATAGTRPSRVAVQCVHQHAAPYADLDVHKVVAKVVKKPAHLSDRFLNDVANRLAAAVEESITSMRPFDRIGTGQARIERVASTRRIHTEEGKILVRYSGDGSNPKLAAAPEGFVDPMVKTITFAKGDTPLARIHYYATHPQTFCCDGQASSDFVAIARETLEQKEGVFQIYFTGAAGDVTVGKYNDGTAQARHGLAQRLMTGMAAAIAATRLAPVHRLKWRTLPLVLPRRSDAERRLAEARATIENPYLDSAQRAYAAAGTIVFYERKRPLELSSLEIGRIHILHLPGEPMLDFQRFAQKLRPDRFVAVAGYGDCEPGYICTDRAIAEGGYEPSASNVGPGSEAQLKSAIRKLIGK